MERCLTREEEEEDKKDKERGSEDPGQRNEIENKSGRFNEFSSILIKLNCLDLMCCALEL